MLASDHPGAYTSMPQPFFGAKGVCKLRKRRAQKPAWHKKPFCLGGHQLVSLLGHLFFNITNVVCAMLVYAPG